MANKIPQDPSRKQSFKQKFTQSVRDFRSNEQLSNVVSHATANTRDTVSYILLIVGIVLLFFHGFIGGIIIGLIAGLYFSSEVLALLQNLNSFIDEQGIVKSLVAGGLLLALFISAPAIFIGLALAVAIRSLLFPEASRLS